MCSELRASGPLKMPRDPVILGIDPGSRRTGWGAVAMTSGARLRSLGAGVLTSSEKLPFAERLAQLHQQLAAVINRIDPDNVAVEDVFFARYASAALKLGHARGVALLAAAQANKPVEAYPPAVVKRCVAGSGSADKTQVARLVAAILGAHQPQQADATDALAVAITAHRSSRMRSAPGEPSLRLR